MPNPSREKGNREERAIVRLLQERGFGAERVPLSGAAGGKFASDVTVPFLGKDRKIESKVRAGGFKQIYSWLAGSDFLVIRRDRDIPLIVMPLSFALDMAARLEAQKSQPLDKAG